MRRPRSGPEQRAEVAEIASSLDAFERFYHEHVEAVQRFVARRVDDPYLAADLTADVFVAAIESAASYRPSRGEPAAWLYGIARNVVAAERRRYAKERRAASRIRGRDLIGDDDLVRLHRRIDAEAPSRSLYRELDRLSESERAVLELVALDGPGVPGQIRVQAFSGSDGTSHATFTIFRSMVQPGLALVIQTATGYGRGGAPGPSSMLVAWAKGEVQPCELVDAFQAVPPPAPEGGKTTSFGAPQSGNGKSTRQEP